MLFSLQPDRARTRAFSGPGAPLVPPKDVPATSNSTSPAAFFTRAAHACRMHPRGTIGRPMQAQVEVPIKEFAERGSARLESGSTFAISPAPRQQQAIKIAWSCSVEAGQPKAFDVSLPIVVANVWHDLRSIRFSAISGTRLLQGLKRRFRLCDLACKCAIDDQCPIGGDQVGTFDDGLAGKVDAVAISSGDEAGNRTNVVAYAGIARASRSRGLRRSRLVAVYQRLVATTEVAKRECEQPMGNRKVRIERDRSSRIPRMASSARLLQASTYTKRDMGPRVVRVQMQRLVRSS